MMRSNELLLMILVTLNSLMIFDLVFDVDKMMKWEEICVNCSLI